MTQAPAWAGSYVSLDQEVLSLATEAGLSARAVQVYVWLRRFRNRTTDLCCPRQETLATQMGVSVRTVRSAVAELLKASFIRIHRHRVEATGNLGVNRYRFPAADTIRQALAAMRGTADAVVGAVVESVQAVAAAVVSTANAVTAAVLSKASDLAKITGAAKAKHSAAAEKRDAKRSAGTPPGQRPDGQANSSDVRAYFEEAAELYWPALGQLPPWTAKEQAQAKLLLEHHGAERTRQMALHIWRNRLHYNLTGIPTPGLLWAMQSRIVGEIAQGIEDLGEHKRAAAQRPSPERSARLAQAEWTRTEEARGILSPEDILSDFGK